MSLRTLRLRAVAFSVFARGHTGATVKEFSEIIDAGEAELLADRLKDLVGLADQTLCRLHLLPVNEVQKGAGLVLLKEAPELLGAEMTELRHLLTAEKDLRIVLDEFLCLEQSGVVKGVGAWGTVIGACRHQINDLHQAVFDDGFLIRGARAGAGDDEFQSRRDVGARFHRALRNIRKGAENVAVLACLKGDGHLAEIVAVVVDAVDAVGRDQKVTALRHRNLGVVKSVNDVSAGAEMHLEEGVVVGAEIQGILVGGAKGAEPKDAERLALPRKGVGE